MTNRKGDWVTDGYNGKVRLTEAFNKHCTQWMPSVTPNKVVTVSNALRACEGQFSHFDDFFNNDDPKGWSPPSLEVLVNFRESGENHITYKNSDGEVIHLTQENCDTGSFELNPLIQLSFIFS